MFLFLPPRLSIFYQCRSGMSDEHSYPTSPSHPQDSGGAGSDGKESGPTQTQSLDRAYRPPASASASIRQHSLSRVQQHHGAPLPDPSLNGPRPSAAKDYRYRCISSPDYLSDFRNVILIFNARLQFCSFHISKFGGALGEIQTRHMHSKDSNYSFTSETDFQFFPFTLQWPSDAGTFYPSCSSSPSSSNSLGSDGLRQYLGSSRSRTGDGVGSFPSLQPVSSTCPALSLCSISFPPCEQCRSSSCPAPTTSRSPHSCPIPCQSCCSSTRRGHAA